MVVAGSPADGRGAVCVVRATDCALLVLLHVSETLRAPAECADPGAAGGGQGYHPPPLSLPGRLRQYPDGYPASREDLGNGGLFSDAKPPKYTSKYFVGSDLAED